MDRQIVSFRERNSTVYTDGIFIYKQQPKYLTDNEMWCLSELYGHGFVPKAERVGVELIKMELIEDQPVTNTEKFIFLVDAILPSLATVGIRHGDLTRPHILARDNKPYVIDWGESRHWDDPRPDKRPEGDEHWLYKTVGEIIYG